MTFNKNYLLFISLILPYLGFAQSNDSQRQVWVDSVFQEMNDAERVGQLFMVRAHSNKGQDHVDKLMSLVKEQQVGGLCFFQGNPEEQARINNMLNENVSHVPLLVSSDAEWGLGMRLKKYGVSFPYNMALGAIQDNKLIYELGRYISDDCKRLGIHINLAPVVDVNNNAANPVINFRSFGEDIYNVAIKSYMYSKGHEDNGVLACAKHFPGHGDTDTDSHLDLPIIKHSRERLDSIELFPFRFLANQGIGSMMVAHLSVPALDNTPNLPTTLSKPVVTGLIREELGYEGLIMTDGLDMDGVTKHHKRGTLEGVALDAGNDILLIPSEVELAIENILKRLEEGSLDRDQVYTSVKRVLGAKYDCGLAEYKPIKIDQIEKDLRLAESFSFRKKLIQSSLTLVRDEHKLFPFDVKGEEKILSIAIGSSDENQFQKRLVDFTDVDFINLGSKISPTKLKSILAKSKKYEKVIVSLHGMSNSKRKNFGMNTQQLDLINALSDHEGMTLIVFGNPYALYAFDKVPSVLVAYSDQADVRDIAAQSIFGVYRIDGKLPVTASDKSAFNDGLVIPKRMIMGFSKPEDMGFNKNLKLKVDSLAKDAIAKRATPGCVVLVAKDGHIVLEEAYGYHTYKKRNEVEDNSVFDLASVTKIAASTLALMALKDDGLIDLKDSLGKHIPFLKGSNKEHLILEDVLRHKSGLKSWIPFYKETVDSRKRPLDSLYSSKSSDLFNIEVARKLYLKDSYVDSVWTKIIDSEVKPEQGYVYSDLGFYLMAALVKEKTGKRIDAFVSERFYKPMQLDRLGFNPLSTIKKGDIPPSERDNYFRQQVVQGYVHDMGAAMLGGVSGHAGLFGTASDLSRIMQMLLNGGRYNGKQYLSANTIRTFTQRCSTCSRRGVGFDMKQLNKDITLNMAESASVYTFGHLGFTGIACWADPKENLIYIFLSNRTYPRMDNNKLGRLNYRPKIQEAVYQALLEKE
jgi:beta-N-acetylhexosaminidase